MIRPNKIKENLKSNKQSIVLSGYFDSPNQVEFISSMNVDGVWIEGEHGPIDFSDIPNISRACDIYGVTSIFRITSHDYGLIYRYLDLGAQGLVIPHVRTKEEAISIVNAAKYHPIGERGMFTSRRGLSVPKNKYMDYANEDSLIIVIIEDVKAISNLDEIIKVENIDVFFVAPNDLAQSMGIVNSNTKDKLNQEIYKAIQKIQKANKKVGTLANSDNIDSYIDMGIDLLLYDTNQFVRDGITSLKNKIK
ncbi:MAG: HpcH/HpaI aldolase family protein [Dehalococcoidia bacterium]